MADNDKQQVPAQIFLQAGPGDDHEEEGGNSLDLSIWFDYLDMVRNRLWLCIAVVVIFLAAAIFYIYTATPIYESGAQLQIQPEPMDVSGIQSVYDPMGTTRDLDQYINTEMELMQTPEVLNRAIAEMELDSSATLAEGNPVRILADNLEISRREETFLININYRSPDAQEAARIANFLGDLYIRQYQERKFEVSGGGLSRLREQLDNLANARNAALQDLTEFKEENQVMSLEYERELNSQRINALSEKLIEYEIDEREAEEAVATIENWREEGHVGAVVQIADNPFAETFRMEQLRKQMELPELLSRFGEGHSEVRTKQEIIGNLQNAVLDEIETSLVHLRLKKQRAARQREIVEEKIRELENDMMSLESLGSEYYRLQDTYKAAEDSYRKVIRRINDINIRFSTDELDQNDFLRMARRAEPGSSPVSPRTRATLAGAGFLGVAAGVGICVLLGMMDPSVKHKDEIDRCMKEATFLGNVPARPEEQSELVAVEETRSQQAEAFRSIRTSLALCLAGRRERCFAVTSAGPGEGKTTVAFNLALAMARDGKKVLLMECDMRRPRFTKLFGDSIDADKKHSVSQLLIGEIELADAAVPFKQQSGLDVIPCGPVPPNAAELLGTETFGQLIRDAKEQYDYVILDSPPLLNVADTEILAGHGISLLFVVRLFKATRHDLRHADERMQTIQAKCAGVVVNQAEVPKHTRYGYYRYGHYRYYHSNYGYSQDHSNNGSGRESEEGTAQEPAEKQNS